jgi:succinoglycan biosynthesis transport protein ExoP
MANIAPLMLTGSTVAEQFGETRRSSSHPTIDSEHLDLAGFARTLWRRKFLVLVASVVIAIVAAGAIFLLAPRYVGRVVLVIGAPETIDPGTNRTPPRTLPDSTAIQTEVELIKSRVNIANVVEKLRLQENPEFNVSLEPGTPQSRLFAVYTAAAKFVEERWKDLHWQLTPGREQQGTTSLSKTLDPAISAAVDVIASRLRVEPKGSSRAIAVEFESANARHSAAVVNAIADQYIEQQRAFREKRMQELTDWLNGKVAVLREQVERSENSVERYRSENGLVPDQAGVSFMAKQMSETDSQLIAAQAERAGLQARLSQLKTLASAPGGLAATTDVLNSAAVQSLARQLEDLQQKRAQLGSDYLPDHPKMVSLSAGIADTRGKIRGETTKIIMSLENEVRIATAKEGRLRQKGDHLRLQMWQANQADITLRALQREARVNSMLLDGFLTRVKEGQDARVLQESEAQIVSYSDVPRFPERPNKPLLVLLALCGALIAAAVLAIAREKYDRSLRSCEEIEPELGLRVLGYVPTTKSLRKPVTCCERPLSLAAEAIRSIYVALRSHGVARSPFAVMVTSAQPKEGKTTLALGIAAMAASSGQTVLFIDADLRKGNATAALGLQGHPGLAEVLIRESDLEAAIVVHAGSGLSCLPVGKHPNLASAVRSIGCLPDLIDLLKLRYDLIVIDTSPVLAVSDALLLAAHVDETVFAIRWGTTSRKVAELALNRLIDSGAKVAGAAVTMVDIRRHAKYGFGDSVLCAKRFMAYYTE